MNTSSISLRHSLLSLALMAAFAVPGAYAATITVDPTAVDEAVATDGKCSLREAVLSVNDGVTVAADCVAAATGTLGTDDTINLPAGTYTLTLAGLDEVQGATPADPVLNTTDATKGDLDLLKSVKIIGAGSATTRIEWAAAVTRCHQHGPDLSHLHHERGYDQH